MQTGHAQINDGKPEGKDQETRERILEVAERLFLAKGFKGVSMKDIADEVQVTTAALYYHFPEGKQDLFLSMVQRTMRKWGQQAFDKAEHLPSLYEQLVTFMQTALAHPPVVHDLMRDVNEFCTDNPRRRNLMRQEGHELQQRINTLFEQAAQRGEITKKVPPQLLASMFGGIMVSLQISQRFGAHDDTIQHSPEDMALMLVNTLFNGIRKQENE